MFNRLLGRLRGIQDKQQRISQFMSAFDQAAADGVLTDEELRDLESTLQELDLTQDDIKRLKVSMAEQVIRKAIDDQRITPGEEHGIQEFIRRFDVPSNRLVHLLDEMRHYRNLYEIEQGRLPEIHIPGVLLKRGEVAHYEAWASTAEEKVVDTYYEGSSSGASFRVAKGMTYRVGASKGRKVEKRANVITSTGKLCITSQRLIYLSVQKPAEMSLDKVANLQFFSNGLMFSATSRAKPVYYNLSPAEAEGIAVMVSAAVNQLP